MSVQSGAHVLGLPEQPAVPAASNAYILPSADPTYTTPFATAGDESTPPPVSAVQIGAHVLGLPEQPAVPAASNANTWYSPPTYTTPFATAGDEPT